MEISYYLNGEQVDNLYCSIVEERKKVSFSLGYTVMPENWNSKDGNLSDEDIYFFTLIRFKEYLIKKYDKLKKRRGVDVLACLKDEVLALTEEYGIEGIARMLFDEANKDTDIPKYDDFICAFEKFSNLKRDEYRVEVWDYLIHFHTKNDVYEMDTYEGKIRQLKDLIENKSYDEIVILTDENIWKEIYIDGGIAKSLFLSTMLAQWEDYWYRQFEEEGEPTGKANRLKEAKEQSWRAFQVYMECYDSEINVIDLAYSVDSFILYPIAVLAMMSCFDKDCCYSEYCEAEFNDSSWECLVLDNIEEDEGPYFYIRTYEDE